MDLRYEREDSCKLYENKRIFHIRRVRKSDDFRRKVRVKMYVELKRARAVYSFVYCEFYLLLYSNIPIYRPTFHRSCDFASK